MMPLLVLVGCVSQQIVPEVWCDTAEPVEALGSCELDDTGCDAALFPLEVRLVIDRDRTGRGVLHSVPSPSGSLFYVGLDLRMPSDPGFPYAPFTFDLVDAAGPVTVAQGAIFREGPVGPDGWAQAAGSMLSALVSDGTVVELVVSDWHHGTTVLRDTVTLRTYPEEP